MVLRRVIGGTGKIGHMADPLHNRRDDGTFAKGNTEGNRWPAGQSGNPGGRPRSAPGFREKCRRAAELYRARLEALRDRDFEVVVDTEGNSTSSRRKNIEAMIKAFEAMADRGGYLPADRQAKMILDVMNAPLTNEQRAAVSAQLVGNDDEPEQLEAPADEGTDE